MCLEIVRANIGGRYGRRSVEAKATAGFEPVSAVDRHYGTRLTLQDLGRICETHGCEQPEGGHQ